MEFEDLLSLARDSYVGQFISFIDHQAQAGEPGASEVKLQLEKSSLYRHYYCVDFLSDTGENRAVELSADEEVTFDPVEVTLGTMAMSVKRLQWDDVVIDLDGPIDPRDLDEWFEDWFDPDGETFDPDTRFSGNIHSLLIEGQTVSADFGTAPVEALIELLVLIESLGYRKIAIR